MWKGITGRCVIIVLLASVCWCLPAAARQITDMAGRQVTVPDQIRKVFGTSPPTTYMVYAIDPDLIVGLNFPFTSLENQYLDQRMRHLPVIGGWFGQGYAANPETLLEVQPDIILIWFRPSSAVNTKIEQALRPLSIPIVYVAMDELADYPAAFRFLGELLDRRERVQALCRYAEQALEETARVGTSIPDFEQVSVYYAEGADGLSTECHASEHARLIHLSGGKNVHSCSDSGTYGMQKISMEQLLHYDPDVIVSHEPEFFKRLAHDPKWKNIRAVQNGRVYRIPRLPMNWFDRPPSFMRLLGLKWMLHRLYPRAYPMDLVSETHHFYQLFLNVDLDEAAISELLRL